MDKRIPFDTAAPEAVGIRSVDILAYIDALERSETEMHGLMIMRHGKLCAQGWWAPFAPELRHGLQSHTKTYAATAVGIALCAWTSASSTFSRRMRRRTPAKT